MEESEPAHGLRLLFPLWRTPTPRLSILTDSRNVRGAEMIADDVVLESLLLKAKQAGQWTVTVKAPSKAPVEVEIDAMLQAIRVRR